MTRCDFHGCYKMATGLSDGFQMCEDHGGPTETGQPPPTPKPQLRGEDVRVFTEPISIGDDTDQAMKRLVKRAKRVNLNPERDGVMSLTYHPNAKMYVLILTILPL